MKPTIPTGPFALFLDVDGTLLDIASTPDGVRVPPELARALSDLNGGLRGALALVSGRSVADLDAIFAPLRLPASGVHGAELRIAGSGPIARTDAVPLPPEAIAALTAMANRYEGTLVENKVFSVAIHYRAVPEAGPLLRHDLDTWMDTPAAAGLRVLPGHMVFEVKGTGFDKGTAVRAFMGQPPFAGRHPVFIGDDVTDIPGLEQARALGGSGYSVTTPREAASGHFDDPEAVRQWLADVAATLCGTEPPAPPR